MKNRLSEMALKSVTGNEALTLSAVLAVMAIAVISVVCYRIFSSSKGSLTLPGGYTFTWGK